MHWYVVQTKPREEEKATFYLEKENVEVYQPKMEVYTWRHGTFSQKPLFPGYLFARFDLDTHVGLVRWARGVKKILIRSDAPTPLSDEIIDSIRGLAQRDGIIRKQTFQQKEKVRIKTGPFKGLEGVFENWISDKGRVQVLLNMVSYQHKVSLHHTLLEKIG